jgi:hypothetical protein
LLNGFGGGRFRRHLSLFVVCDQPAYNDDDRPTVVTCDQGGDEVAYNCWAQDKSVKPGCSFASDGQHGAPPPPPIANETTYNQLEARFEKLLHAELAANHKLPMHWHDPITERGIDYPRSTMIEVWDGTNRSVLSAVLGMGYPAVYAGSYYLDHLQLNWESDLYTVDPGKVTKALSCLLLCFPRLSISDSN